MKIKLNKLKETFHFEAVNEDGKVVEIDGAPAIGGNGMGVRPMQLLIMGLGGCSGIDVCLILKKQKVVFDSFEIELDAERYKDQEPALFENVLVKFIFKGDIKANKVKRAVELSMDKYCSVAAILRETAKIDYEVIINGEKV